MLRKIGVYSSKREARSAIFEYLEYFYYTVRLHSMLQYVSPVAFEQGTPLHMN
jgi:putative transposase